MNRSSVSVLGAGMVGICCAIELQRAGYQVNLIDRRQPGSETSSGNAGILSTSSIAPLASPLLWPRLPGLIAGLHADFKLHYPHLPQLLPWLSQFLLRCNRQSYFSDGAYINRLTVASVAAHQDLIRESNAEQLANHQGSMRIYRRSESFDKDELERELFRRCELEFEVLNRDEITDMEPDLNLQFVKAVWIKNAISIKNPQALCQRYADYFQSIGGVIEQLEIKGLSPSGDAWEVHTGQGRRVTPRLVVALGAWTPELIGPLGYKNVIAAERGYHMMFAAQDEKRLNRPVFDVDSHYVMIPMAEGIRITSGSNLCYREARPTPGQLERVIPRAREAFPLAEPLLDQPWMGRRPSTPDSLPIIGAAPRHENLWLAYAHAHMGFTMGPITGQIIASQIEGSPTPLDAEPYSPSRYF